MPSIPWKNTLYKSAFSCLAPYYNFNRVTLGDCDLDIKRFINRRQLQSATLLCLNNGIPVCDIRTGRTNAPAQDAWYHVASIAKMVTAFGALKQCEMGLLSLDAPVGDYSRLPIKGNITLRQLLTHTSSIIDTPAYHTAVAKRLPLSGWVTESIYDNAFKPGEHFQYSNLGFGLVGSLMEEATNYSLHHWMNENVFLPLKMEASYDLTSLPEEATLISSQRLFPPQRSYSFNADARRQHASVIAAADPMTHFGLAAGGLYATAKALISFVDELACDRQGVLSSSLVSQMLKPAATLNFGSYRCGFGLGVFCIENNNGDTIYGHQGFAYGAVQGAFWHPQTKRCVVSLNGGADETRVGRLGRTNLDVINLFLGGNQWI